MEGNRGTGEDRAVLAHHAALQRSDLRRRRQALELDARDRGYLIDQPRQEWHRHVDERRRRVVLKHNLDADWKHTHKQAVRDVSGYQLFFVRRHV